MSTKTTRAPRKTASGHTVRFTLIDADLADVVPPSIIDSAGRTHAAAVELRRALGDCAAHCLPVPLPVLDTWRAVARLTATLHDLKRRDSADRVAQQLAERVADAAGTGGQINTRDLADALAGPRRDAAAVQVLNRALHVAVRRAERAATECAAAWHAEVRSAFAETVTTLDADRGALRLLGAGDTLADLPADQHDRADRAAEHVERYRALRRLSSYLADVHADTAAWVRRHATASEREQWAAELAELRNGGWHLVGTPWTAGEARARRDLADWRRVLDDLDRGAWMPSADELIDQARGLADALGLRLVDRADDEQHDEHDEDAA